MLFFRFLPIVIIYIFVIGCKKEEVPNPKNFGYLTTQCKLVSWGMYFLKYDSHNRITEIHKKGTSSPWDPTTALYRTLEYENGELKRIIVPKLEPKDFDEARDAWTEVEYEYGPYGLTAIRKFGYDGIRNGKFARMETDRYEFKYNNSHKPFEMLIYAHFSIEVDDLRVRARNTFEYDSKGNLTDAISESIIDGKVDASLPIKYFYDDYPNTTKVPSFIGLEYIMADRVFSTNNRIRIQYTQDASNSNYDYDDHGNVLSKSSGTIAWDCQ